MNLAERVKRIETLPPGLRDVLGHVARGMSNDQIALALGYKNARTVGTLVNTIYTELGLRSVRSIIEKRTLATQAFQRATSQVLQIQMSNEEVDLLPLDDRTRRRLHSALRKGFKVNSVSIVLHKQ